MWNATFESVKFDSFELNVTAYVESATEAVEYSTSVRHLIHTSDFTRAEYNAWIIENFYDSFNQLIND